MLDILSIIPGKKRPTANGWTSFNAVCCHHRNHRPDKRSRGGIKIGADSWGYYCFNCGFKCSATVGRHFTDGVKTFLGWCGLDDDRIDRLSFESFREGGIAGMARFKREAAAVKFEERPLPEGARSLDPDKDTHHVEYLRGRGLSHTDYPFYVVDNPVRDGIIIPYFQNGRIVGNTTRFYTDRHPKYLSEQQSGYVFNLDAQRINWHSCIVVEGQFDAISIGGCAYLGSTISDGQAAQLSRLQRRIIVVPDRDKTGMSVCDRALELGYHVSIPEWDPDIKDVNDAVKRYGRLPTLLSILQSATSSKIKVEMTRKKFT
jgi:hypothetical protein